MSAWEPFRPKGPFPVRRYGPNGQEAEFAKQEDVPPGWEDHPSKVKTPIVADSAPIVADSAPIVADSAPIVADSSPRKPITLRRKTPSA